METTGWYLSIGMCFVLVYCCVIMLMTSCFGGTKPILGRKRITLPEPSEGWQSAMSPRKEGYIYFIIPNVPFLQHISPPLDIAFVTFKFVTRLIDQSDCWKLTWGIINKYVYHFSISEHIWSFRVNCNKYLTDVLVKPLPVQKSICLLIRPFIHPENKGNTNLHPSLSHTIVLSIFINSITCNIMTKV